MQGRGAGGPAPGPHPGAQLRPQPAHDNGGPQPAGAGDDERGGQLHQIHPRRRHHYRGRGDAGREGVDRGVRHRYRHPPEGPGADI